jgi:hypothetical protein
MEHAVFNQGLAQQLANHLKAENLYHTVRQEMGEGRNSKECLTISNDAPSTIAPLLVSNTSQG